jgi:hypothetical protein
VAPSSLPPYHTPFLSVALCAPERCARNRSLACSRNCDLCLVSSRLVRNRGSSSSSPQSLYVSFFFLASQQSTFETPLPPPPPHTHPPLLPSRTFCTLPLHLEEKKEKACPVLRSASRCVCASGCNSSHLEGGISRQRALLRERERASEPQNALRAFVCASCVKILYELGGRGYRGALSSVVVHLLAFVEFQFLERDRENARARSLQPYSSVIILCSSRFFQVERSESASLSARSLVRPVRQSLYCVALVSSRG